MDIGCHLHDCACDAESCVVATHCFYFATVTGNSEFLTRSSAISQQRSISELLGTNNSGGNIKLVSGGASEPPKPWLEFPLHEVVPASTVLASSHLGRMALESASKGEKTRTVPKPASVAAVH